MATKTQSAQPVERLSGTLQGKRFKVVLDDIKIGDKWENGILSLLAIDGLGHPDNIDGVIIFRFRDYDRSTITFTLQDDVLTVDSFSKEVHSA